MGRKNISFKTKNKKKKLTCYYRTLQMAKYSVQGKANKNKPTKI
jgi:hypothetical protein